MTRTILGLRTAQPRRRRAFPWKLAITTGLLAAVIGAAVVTASELAVFGHSVGHSNRSTSVFGGSSSKTATPTPTATATDEPDETATAQPTQTPTAKATQTATEAPTVTVTPPAATHTPNTATTPPPTEATPVPTP